MKTSTTLYFLLTFSLAGTITFAQMTKTIQSGRGMVLSNVRGFQLAHPSALMDIRSTTKGVLFPRMTTANRDAIGSPQAGLWVYNISTNQFNFYNGSAWQEISLDKQWGINGNALYHSGQVGIGTSTMINTNTFLTVRGSGDRISPTLEGMYVDATLITAKPFYGYSLNDSSVAYHYFDGTLSKWALSINGSDKLSVRSTGEVDASGGLTVNGGKGIVYNMINNVPQKYYTQENSFSANLAAFGTSTEGTITFEEGYNSPPKATVGNITTGSCTSGSQYHLQLVLYGCTTNTCKYRLVNTSNIALKCNVTWNIIFIGN